MPTTYAIPNGATVFAATLWTGADTGTGRSISGLQFAPDLWWGKSRSAAYYHQIFDSVRGAGSGKALASNDNGAEGIGNGATYGYLSSFDSSGVTYTRGSAGSGTNPDGYAYYDESGTTYVGWGWKAGGAAVSNTAGSITSQVSANTTAGFSVVTYTGNGSASATVGHGLGVVPNMVIVKQRSAVNDWWVKHSSLGSNLMLILDSTSATYNGTLGGGGGIADLTSSSTFGFVNGTSNVNNVNASGGTFVAYCWAAVAGYSAFGSYTGNGSSDGPFVYLGFRPRFLCVKRTDSTQNWITMDTSRGTYNCSDPFLYPNLANAEDANAALDLLSNGFKWRSSALGGNDSGGTFIYMAFAENPFKYANAR